MKIQLNKAPTKVESNELKSPENEAEYRVGEGGGKPNI